MRNEASRIRVWPESLLPCWPAGRVKDPDTPFSMSSADKTTSPGSAPSSVVAKELMSTAGEPMPDVAASRVSPPPPHEASRANTLTATAIPPFRASEKAVHRGPASRVLVWVARKVGLAMPLFGTIRRLTPTRPADRTEHPLQRQRARSLLRCPVRESETCRAGRCHHVQRLLYRDVAEG